MALGGQTKKMAAILDFLKMSISQPFEEVQG